MFTTLYFFIRLWSQCYNVPYFSSLTIDIETIRNIKLLFCYPEPTGLDCNRCFTKTLLNPVVQVAFC